MAIDKIAYETAKDEVGPPLIPMKDFRIQIILSESRYLNLSVQHEEHYTSLISFRPDEVHELIRKLQVGLKYMLSDGSKLLKAVPFGDLAVNDDFLYDDNNNYIKIIQQDITGGNWSISYNAISDDGVPRYFESSLIVSKVIKV